jgi:Sortilin, neurotensin receptor 3, C-terminal
MSVKNIINFKQQFIIYGWASDNTGLAVKIDLDGTEFRRCLNPIKAGTVTSDFEILNKSTSQCIDGLNVQYLIRKADAHCLIRKLDETVFVEPCECTVSDYECSDGFAVVDGQCTGQFQQGSCDSGTSYMVYSGYKKRVGNKCEKGIQFIDERVSCGFPLYVKLLGGFAFIYLLILIRKHYLKEKIEQTLRSSAKTSRQIFDDEEDELRV